MRRIVISSLVVVSAASAWAQDPPPPAPPAQPPTAPTAPAAPAAPAGRTLADGKLTDPYWGFTLAVAGLAEAKGVGGPGKVFEGKAGDLVVEILVNEGDRVRTSEEWRAEAQKTWEDRKREMKEPATGDDPVPWTTFSEKSLAGYDRFHGYSFQARGLHGFLVHAYVNEKKEGTPAEMAKALAALKLGPDTGASVVAFALAKRASLPPDSLDVLLGAGQTYLQPKTQGGGENPAMAEAVLAKALATAKEGDLDADQRQIVHEMLGLATLTQRKTDAAIGWFKKSAELAAKTTTPDERAAVANYNLCCAYSVAGKLDEAFAALETSFAKSAPVDADHLGQDPDLENLRKDPRWQAFLAKRSAPPDAPK